MAVIQYDKSRSFRIWDIKQIWKGPNNPNSGAVAPNPRDIIVDPDVGLYLVISVDGDVTDINPTPTFLSVLRLILPFSQIDGQLTHQSTILDRIYFNNRVSPPTLVIDPSYIIAGSEAAFMKLFKGTDTSNNTGTVISAIYNGNNIVSENITLERINPNNDAEKRPTLCNCTHALSDKELITGVIYNHQGGVMGERIFVVKNTNAMRGLGQSTDYIVDVMLVTSMLDPNIIDMVNVPANVPISGGDFRAKLIYNSGATSEIAVGTPKCKVFGLDNFNTSLAGVPGNIVLTYYPDEDEAVVNTTNPGINNLSHMYSVRTVNNVLDASYRIYVVPKYNVAQERYSNDYYLTDLQYGLFVKIPNNQITVRALTQAPLDYDQGGDVQVFVLSCKPANFVDSAPNDYTFVQMVTIRFGTPTSYPWLLDYRNNNNDLLGMDNYAEFSTNAVTVRSARSTLNSWLEKLWYPLHPIFDDTQFTFAPSPTHFKLMYGNEVGPVREVVSNWNAILPRDFTAAFVDKSTIAIVWLKSTTVEDEYLTLGVTPMWLQNTL